MTTSIFIRSMIQKKYFIKSDKAGKTSLTQKSEYILKFFWKDLGQFVLRSLIYAYAKVELE